MLQVEYLSDYGKCTDQVMQRQRRKKNNREPCERWGKRAIVREMTWELAMSIERLRKQKEEEVRIKR